MVNLVMALSTPEHKFDSKEMYRSLVESSDAAISVVDTHGEYLFVNTIGAANFGLLPSDMIGKNVTDFFLPDETATILGDVREAIERDKSKVLQTRVTILGEMLEFRTSIQPVHDANGKAHAAMIHASNITDLLAAEMALRRSATRLEGMHLFDIAILESRTPEELARKATEQLIDLIPTYSISIVTFDLQARTVTLLAQHFADETIFGLGDVYPIAGFDLDEFFASTHYLVSDTSKHPLPIMQLAFQFGIGSVLAVGLRADGKLIGALVLGSKPTHFFMDEHIHIAVEVADSLSIGMQTTALNARVQNYATELEQRVIERTQELEDAKKRVEAIIDNSSDGILVIALDGSIQQSNRAFCRLFGIDTDAYLNRRLDSLVHPDDIPLVQRTMHDVSSLGPTGRIEVRARRHDGSLFDVEIGITRTQETQPIANSMICVIHDITERKVHEESLQRALLKEKELGQLKSHFVSTASHEFRTPLAAILSTTELMRTYRSRMTEQDINQRLDRMSAYVQQMVDMVEDVLQLSRMQSERVDFQPLRGDLDALCRDIVDEFSATSENQGRFNYSCVMAPVTAVLDFRLLRRAISNLVGNALKYSPPDSQVIIRLTQNAQTAVLSVTDDGIGIPPADLPLLFEPFYRAANTGGVPGTGLGLSIAKQAVDAHNGFIHVDSEVGVGTTITLTIPISR